MNEYPDNWPEIATRIKDRAEWKCERCGRAHDPKTGYCLTVHHFVPDKALCEDWNLAALCQRCHLSIQSKVSMEQRIFEFVEIAAWFAPHLAGFLKWKRERQLTFGGRKGA